MTTTTPTPAHVALLEEFANAVIDYQLACSSGFTAHIGPAIDRRVKARNDVYDALAQPALAAPVLPHCWMVSGSSRAHFGEYAEHDATEEARRCGGGARAYPLHMPQPTPAASPAMRTVSEEEALQGSRWVSSDDVRRMTQQIHRAMYPDVAPAVNCLLCDIVAEVCARLESQVMQPVEAIPKPCFMCHGAGWHWMSCAIPAGVEPPKPQKMKCTQCGVPAVTVEVAAPVAPTEIERLAKVAIRECPWKPDQHPNDWSDAALQVCRAVVSGDALSAAKPELSDAQIDAATAVWFGTADSHKAHSWRSHMRAAIAAAQAGGATT